MGRGKKKGRGGKKGDGKERVGRGEETPRCGKKREREERIGRGKEEHRESLQEDNTDVMVLPLDLDWPDWSLDSPTTSQARSGWQSTSFKQSSENWQSQMNEVN